MSQEYKREDASLARTGVTAVGELSAIMIAMCFIPILSVRISRLSNVSC